ncbi:MAG TPA: phage baseplate assembly protein V [Pyrinomonadaceae bacterium]|nr:phage baseplate assembly protein V [Pyrinomonadaceae bacterium]
MIEETIGNLETSVEESRQKYYGVTVGKVINPLDPMMLGRVQVQLPFIDSLDLSPWARIALPMAGMLHGTYFIPNLNDEVLVAFEHGDVNAPYIIGSLWNAMAPPPLQSPVPQIRAIRTLAGNQIVFTEVPPSVTIQTAPTPPSVLPSPPTPTGPYQTIMMSTAGIQIMSPTPIQIMSPAGIQIVAGTNIINLTPDGITITGAPNLNLVAAGTLNMTAPAINITGGLVKIN